MSGPRPAHNRAFPGTLRAGHAPPLRCCYTFLHVSPCGQLAGVDALDLVNGQILGRVGRVDDDCDAVQCQNSSLGTALDLGVLQLTAGHADGVGAVQRAGNTGGGVGGEQLKLSVGVDSLVGLDQLLHQRRDRGGAADGDLAGRLGGGEVRTVLTDVALIGGKRLTVLAQDIGDEVHGHGVGGIAVGNDVERTGQYIAAVLDGLGGGGHTADRDGLDGVVQRAEADVADGGLIVGNSGHDAVGAGLDGSGLGGVVDLLAVSVLLLNASQLNEGAAGAGAVLTGDDRDVLIGVKVTGGGGRGSGGISGTAGGKAQGQGSGGNGSNSRFAFHVCVLSLFTKFMWYSLCISQCFTGSKAIVPHFRAAIDHGAVQSR